MCGCHSILECCVTFSGVKLSIRSFVLLGENNIKYDNDVHFEGVKTHLQPPFCHQPELKNDRFRVLSK